MEEMMANKEHLAILKQGVEAWNNWREENPLVIPSLRGADLRQVNLVGVNLFSAYLLEADLRYAKLDEANLIEAELSGAKLDGANLHAANLSRASLIQATLSGTVLSRADLREADLHLATMNNAILTEANLIRVGLGDADLRAANLRLANLGNANFMGTELTRADLSLARCRATQFSNLDLSLVIGLDTIEHRGPSFIDIHTLYASRGRIPPIFLQGCGIPKDFIEAIPDLVRVPRKFHSCFISYSHQDRSFTERLQKTLQGHYVVCWRDDHSMKRDASLTVEIDRAIQKQENFLLCCSKSSMNSPWVETEIELALLKEQEIRQDQPESTNVVIALDLDGYIFGEGRDNWKARRIRSSRIVIDFKEWMRDDAIFERGIEQVLRALRTDSGKEPPPEPKL